MEESFINTKAGTMYIRLPREENVSSSNYPKARTQLAGEGFAQLEKKGSKHQVPRCKDQVLGPH